VGKQNKLVIEILRHLYNNGILQNVLLIGSWCSSFYKEYFQGIDYNPRIKTRDIDFLLPLKPKFTNEIDLSELFKPLGFEIELNRHGYMKLESDELALEFLIPEVGPPKDKPYPLPKLKFSAQPLRHLSMLWRKPVQVTFSKIPVFLPHPADFCLHKIIISGKRKKAEKAEKDLYGAFEVLDALIESDEKDSLIESSNNLTIKEKKTVIKGLRANGYNDLANLL